MQDLVVLQGEFSIHRLEPNARVPQELGEAPFCWTGRTAEELSIVCHSSIDLTSPRRSDGWSCLMVRGPLDFSLTGILAGIAGTLASSSISLVALSTFDTDYFLVKTTDLDGACECLSAAGYRVATYSPPHTDVR